MPFDGTVISYSPLSSLVTPPVAPFMMTDAFPTATPVSLTIRPFTRMACCAKTEEGTTTAKTGSNRSRKEFKKAPYHN